MKFIRIIAGVIFVFSTYLIWGGVVNYVSTGGKGLGNTTTKVINSFSEFPRFIFSSLSNSERFYLSQTYIHDDPAFKELNNLQTDIFALHTFWNSDDKKWSFTLVNLKNDSTHFTWSLGEDILLPVQYDRPFRDLRPFHTELLPDKSLIVNFARSNNLFKIDSNSNVVWKNHALGFHHSMNLDTANGIWICAENQGEYAFFENKKKYSTKLRNLDRVEMAYNDDLIVNVNRFTGEIQFQKSVSEILVENNYTGLLFNTLDYRGDPIHLNDIQPVLTDSKFWKKGDLFLSLRNLSSIALYRPSTNKIIWLRQGPFINQHDVDIISPTEISIFNNNINFAWGANYTPISNIDPDFILKSNTIITYNFENNEFTSVHQDYLEREQIKTRSEGQVEFLSNGNIFIEEQNHGKIYIFNNSESIYKKKFKTEERGRIHMTNWIRLYEVFPF